jgi:hypothetical protein
MCTSQLVQAGQRPLHKPCPPARPAVFPLNNLNIRPADTNRDRFYQD